MPGNTSESVVAANVGEQLRKQGMDPNRIQGIKDMADLLQSKYGVNLMDPKSVKAGIARISALHDLLMKDSTGTASQDASGDKNATVNISNILQGINQGNNSIFDSL